MSYLIFEFYKKNCGSNIKIFGEMRKLYYLTQGVPIIVLLFSVILTAVYKKIWIILLGVILTLFLFTFLLRLLNSNARKIAVKRKYIKENKGYKGFWNNIEVLEKLKEDDKKDLKLFLKDKNKYDVGNITRALNEIDEMLIIYKPKFPVLPAIFGGLIIAWYSAFVSWIFDKTDSFDMMSYSVALSLGVLCLLFIFYKIYTSIVNLINEMFFSKDYDSIKRMRKIIDEIHFEMTN